jgi:hypothetical protein
MGGGFGIYYSGHEVLIPLMPEPRPAPARRGYRLILEPAASSPNGRCHVLYRKTSGDRAVIVDAAMNDPCG